MPVVGHRYLGRVATRVDVGDVLEQHEEVFGRQRLQTHHRPREVNQSLLTREGVFRQAAAQRLVAEKPAPLVLQTLVGAGEDEAQTAHVALEAVVEQGQ